jgi:hypothetical protein
MDPTRVMLLSGLTPQSFYARQVASSPEHRTFLRPTTMSGVTVGGLGSTEGDIGNLMLAYVAGAGLLGYLGWRLLFKKR